MTAISKSLEGRRSVDPVGLVELLLNQVFLSVFQTDAARSRFGFNHISLQVSVDGLPGWYLWFSGRRGAFLLKALGSVPAVGSIGGIGTGPGARLGVFYYPHVDEDDFESFSWPEKIVRCGDFFDSTGTPTPEGGPKIPDPFFLVGQIEMRLDARHRFIEIESRALERLRSYRAEGLRVQDPSGRMLEVVAAGGRDRDIPGWELTCFLTDKLVLGVCFQQRRAPLSVVISKKEGVASYLYENQRIEQRREPRISERILSVCLSAPAGIESSIRSQEYAAAVSQRLGGDWAGSMTGGASPYDERLSWVNPEWWQAQKEPFQLAGGCGCCQHEH